MCPGQGTDGVLRMVLDVVLVTIGHYKREGKSREEQLAILEMLRGRSQVSDCVSSSMHKPDHDGNVSLRQSGG